MRLVQNLALSAALAASAFGLFLHATAPEPVNVYPVEVAPIERTIHEVERVVEVRLVETSPVAPDWVEISNVWKLEIGIQGSGTAWPIECRDTGRGYFEVYFVTAAHCVPEGVSHYRAIHADGGWAGGPGLEDEIRRHPDRDIAVLKLYSQKPIPCRSLHGFPIQVGTEVFLASYPTGAGPWITSGYYSGDSRSSAAGYPGSSGAPVCLADGSVVGILVSGRGNGFDFVPFATFLELLHDLKGFLDVE